MNRQIRRRDVLRGIGATAMAGALAGCSTETQNDGGDGGGDGASDGGDGGSGGEVPSEVDDYLSDANLYDGSIADMTGESNPTVEVGAGEQGYAFDPPAIRVSTGTTVTWEWTGTGGGHNVVHDGGEFTSGESDYVSEAGYTYEYTFENTGNYLYYCTPHQGLGMLGAVVVE